MNTNDPQMEYNKQPVVDILIVTYPKDYKWLEWSFKTLRKHMTGYRNIHIVLQGQSEFCERPNIISNGVTLHYEPGWEGRGYFHQQWIKLNADKYSDADYILHIDSDSFVKGPCDVMDFFEGNKPVWLWSWYTDLGDTVPWQAPTEKAVGATVDKEYMRTPVVIMDIRTYPSVRNKMAELHGDASGYIFEAPVSGYKFSEYNVAGYVADTQQNSFYEWVYREEYDKWPPGINKIQQFWSKSNLEDHLPVIREMLGEESAGGLPIYCNKMGHWLVVHDTHFTNWVEAAQRLDHDQAFMARVLPFLKPGMTAVDVGANIGTHTHAYAKAVAGVDGGRVFAFEPNPLPYECLRRNMMGHGHVECYNVGLGPMAGEFGMEMSNNVGASYMVPGTGFKVRTLDGYELSRCDYIKMDAEGFEMGILLGAARTIAQFRPVLVIEINVGALARNGVLPEDIFGWLRLRGYDIDGYMADEPQYDIICTPR